MVIIIHFLVRKGYKGFAFFPFIFLKKWEFLSDKRVINHERIHIRQQLEMLIIFFYLWYGIEYLIRRVQFGTWAAAYYNISLESEAFANDKDLQYLKTRKPYAWLKFLNVT